MVLPPQRRFRRLCLVGVEVVDVAAGQGSDQALVQVSREGSGAGRARGEWLPGGDALADDGVHAEALQDVGERGGHGAFPECS